jgi:hypothetical protein
MLDLHQATSPDLLKGVIIDPMAYLQLAKKMTPKSFKF